MDIVDGKENLPHKIYVRQKFKTKIKLWCKKSLHILQSFAVVGKKNSIAIHAHISLMLLNASISCH